MLTVLMATRNRARILRDVLTTYCQLQPPKSGWKLVIVDNGSTDETQEMVATFQGRLPLTCMTEPALGKNNALNTGLAFVEGDLTIFTDDDVFPRPDWLIELRKAADLRPAYSIFGGTILARWEVPPSPWIDWIDLGPIFTITNPSLADGEVAPIAVLGPNMAVRASIFREGIRLDPSIGPCGSSYPMGSETEFLLRLGQQGHKAWHVHNAVVEHFVRKEQLDKNWVIQRGIRFGRGQHRLSPHLKDVKSWMGFPLHLARDIPKELFLIAMAWLFFRRGALFRARWRFNVLLGKAVEARSMARNQVEVHLERRNRNTSALGDTHPATSSAERRSPRIP